ncbi:MAG: hypothetical protein ACM4D3_09230 [Candidatus Sericytochromatia bacterium]
MLTGRTPFANSQGRAAVMMRICSSHLSWATRDQFTEPVMERLKATRTDQGLTQIISVKPKIDGADAIATLDAQNEV